MSGPTFKTYVLEYRALLGFDGLTPAPAWDTAVVGADQIYRFEAPAIGVIPLWMPIDGEPNSNGAYAKRWVTWALLLGETLLTPEPRVALAVTNSNPVDPTAMLPVESYLLTIPPAPPGFIAEGVYSRRCLFVPQGYGLVVRDVSAFADGRPAVLRMRVIVEQSVEDEALWMSACCCKSEFVDNVVTIPSPG